MNTSDPVPFTEDSFNALVSAQHHLVTALLAVMPRAQRQALAQELTVLANRSRKVDSFLAGELLQHWAERAKQSSEVVR